MIPEKEKRKTLTAYGFEKQTAPIFYELLIGNEEKFAYPVPIKGKIPKSLIECYECYGIERRILGTSHFTLVGTKIADIYHHPRHVIASKKVISLFNSNNVIGYKVCEVIFQDSENIEREYLDELRELEILGRCYKIHSIDSCEIEHCSVCKKVTDIEKTKATNGIKILEEYWDGSDIFMFDYGTLSVIVTEKVKNILEVNEISNVQFKPLKDMKMR